MPDHASGQPLPEWVDWDCCDQVHDDGTPCTGAAQSDYARCLVHLGPDQLAKVMTPRPDGTPPDLDARGVRLAAGDLERVLAAAWGDDSSLCLRGVSLNRATVEGDVSLDGATVKGDVSLSGARVKGGVSLLAATVEGNGVFLIGATVEGGVFLGGATVAGEVCLLDATVERDLFIAGGTVVGEVDLLRATVEGGVHLDYATVKGDVFLREATIKGQALLGPTSLGVELSLAESEFTRMANLDVTAKRVDLSRARLLGGLTARVNGAEGTEGAEVVMERVEMQGPAILAAGATGSAVPASPPRLLRLAGTDVASLTLTGVDLTTCHFSATINLDKLHIDGSPQLDVWRGRWRGWRTHRKVIADETKWRNEWHDAAGNTSCREGLRKRAYEIAAVYRALRKGREDSKDEPGAADFYYGETAMRRKAAGCSVEGLLLTGYWLLSGYGLRAWRALTALLVLITAATILFATIGFAPTSVTVYRPIPARDAGTPSYQITSVPGPRPGWATALDYSVQSTTSLLRSPQTPPPLTSAGKVLEIFLRFAGPGLLALAVLALRGRVKR